MTETRDHDKIIESNRIPFLMMLLPGILGTALAYQILFITEETEGNSMTWGQVVSILVAVISVFGVLVVGFWQLKRDGKTIDQISEKTATIKEKTALMEQNVNGQRGLLERNTANLENFSKDLSAMTRWTNTIDSLGGVELEIQERMRKEYSDSITNKDIVMAEINVLYQTNAKLQEENRALKEDIRTRDRKIRQLEQEIANKERKREAKRSSREDRTWEIER